MFVLGLHGYVIVKRKEPELRMYLLAINEDGHQIAVATSGFAYTETSTTGIRSTVHGLSESATGNFDGRLSKFPELEGYVAFTASFGGTYENTVVMIAPVAGIREPGVAGPGGQFTLGRNGNRLMWDFAQRALTIPGSMMATNTIGSEMKARIETKL